VKVICQNTAVLALARRRLVLWAAGGVSALDEVNTTLTPLGRLLAAGKTADAPVTPFEAGSPTVVPLAASACVDVVAGDGDGDGEIFGDGEPAGPADAPGAADAAGGAEGRGTDVTPPPPQPAIAARARPAKAT